MATERAPVVNTSSVTFLPINLTQYLSSGSVYFNDRFIISCSAFLGLCIFSSNPFLRSNSFPSEGAGLNPILQDLALSFHPPILYIGYVGLSVSFSFSIEKYS